MRLILSCLAGHQAPVSKLCGGLDLLCAWLVFPRDQQIISLEIEDFRALKDVQRSAVLNKTLILVSTFTRKLQNVPCVITE